MSTATPEIITSKSDMRRWSRLRRSAGATIALIPTMGFLHEGHLSLVREARRRASAVVVSIYVNPGQFAPSEDLSTYPADLRGDLAKLAALGGVDAAFCPRDLYDYGEAAFGGGDGECGGSSCVEEAGGDGRREHETWIRVERLERGMCGRSRPIFFRGVATVVAKLFHVVEPDIAVFGKKDYQQWRVIRRMVRDLDFAVEVIGSEIVREPDGLAMSSRNVHLSPEDRQKALSISRSLSEAASAAKNGQSSCGKLVSSVVGAISEAGGRVDYAEIVDQENLDPLVEITRSAVFCIAAWFGKVRLIDNMEINI